MLKSATFFAIACVWLLAGAGCSLTADPGEPEPKLELETAEEFEGELLDGEPAASADYSGKPLIINFWASWCSPCRAEMPELIEAYETHKDDIQFIGVNFRDTKALANRFYDEFEVPYESFFDQSGKIGFSYGVRALPATFFIDSDGMILGRQLGALDREELDAGIELLLGGL